MIPWSPIRIIDYDDWYINHEVYKWLDTKWGPHTVDWFATCYNAQVERFNSRYACPGSEAVDAFTVDWSMENNWWCIQQGRSGSTLFNGKFPNTEVIALRIEF